MSKTSKREMVDTQDALATRLGVSAQVICERAKNAEWRKRVKRRGKYDVQSAMEDQTERRSKDLNQMGASANNALKALRAKKIAGEIEADGVRYQMILRENDQHKIEYEAKRKLWFDRATIIGWAQSVAHSFDSALRAVELTSRDPAVVNSVREIFERVRKKLSEDVGGEK